MSSVEVSSWNYVVADAFTDKPLEGNPVAVFTDAIGLEAAHMQRIARELNLSETTFVFPPEANGDFRVRIFTPVNELPFAGHPTLGTAVVLARQLDVLQLNLETAMGLIPFKLERDMNGRISTATMEQPIPVWEPYDQADQLLAGLGLKSSLLPIEVYRNGPRHVLVCLATLRDLTEVRPDLRVLSRLPDVAVYCVAGSGSHWRLRMFSPAYGVAEDAATGSAAGPLAIHLIRHGLLNFSQLLTITQGVEIGRRSLMRVLVQGSLSKIGPIRVSGAVTVVARGELFRSPG